MKKEKLKQKEKEKIPAFIGDVLCASINQRLHRLNITISELVEKTGVSREILIKTLYGEKLITRQLVQLIKPIIERYELILPDEVFENTLTHKDATAEQIKDSISKQIGMFDDDDEIYILVIVRYSYFKSKEYSEKKIIKDIEKTRNDQIKEFQKRK